MQKKDENRSVDAHKQAAAAAADPIQPTGRNGGRLRKQGTVFAHKLLRDGVQIYIGVVLFQLVGPGFGAYIVGPGVVPGPQVEIVAKAGIAHGGVQAVFRAEFFQHGGVVPHKIDAVGLGEGPLLPVYKS